MNYFIVIVLCVISLSVSVVFNQDIKETSIDIYRRVEEKSDDDSSSNLVLYEALLNYTDDKRFVESTAKAIADVINELFIKQNIPFDILMFDYIVNGTIDLIHELGKILLDNYAATVKKIEQNEIGKINQSALILTDEENIEEFNRWVNLANVFPKKLKFLIYTLKSGDLFDAPKFLVRTGDISQFEYFLFDKNDEELELTTFEWFTDKECNFKTYKVLNTFNRTSLKWQKKLENHEKFKNLQNCMIHVKPLQGSYQKMNNAKKQSFAFDIMDIVAQRRNFTAVRGERSREIKTKIQGKEQINQLEYNIVLDGHFLSEYKNFHITTTFTEQPLIFIITPGELYTYYEKILLPFDELTWYFLIATFGVAFAVIFVVNLMPKYVQDYFYGEGDSIPAFNVIGTFFGIGQLRLPTANFPRFILMIFILFCLIIRTAYQGVMFEMMTKEMRKSSPQTIDDLFEWNFSVNLLTVNSQFIPVSRLFYNNIDESRQNIIKKYETRQMYSEICSIIFNPKQRFAVEIDMNLFTIMTNFCKMPPMLLNEEFMKIPIGIAMDKNNFLYEAIEEVMQLTIPTGIPQYWSKYHQWFRNGRNHYTEIEEDEPQMFKLEDLSFGFIIWLIACGVAVLGLLCELIVFVISKLKKLTRVEPIQVNNTNILLPKRPIKIKVKKAKKQREFAQQNSTLDVQILMEIQEKNVNSNEVELRASEINLNNDENLQQTEKNQQQTVIDENIDEGSESRISSRLSPKLETARIAIENEKTANSNSSKVTDYKDLFLNDAQDFNDVIVRSGTKISTKTVSKIAATKIPVKIDKNKSSKISSDANILNKVDDESITRKTAKLSTKHSSRLETTRIAIENEKTASSSSSMKNS